MSTYEVKIQEKEIETSVISNPLALKSGLTKLLLSVSMPSDEVRHVVGLDIEQTNDDIDLLKLASSTTCLLIQLRYFTSGTLPFELGRFLQLPEITFIGVGIRYSLDALERVYKIRCRNHADLGELVATIQREPSFRYSGLLNVANYFHICDERVKSPDVAFGDWNAAELSEEQIRSATADAYLPLLIGRKLRI